MLKPIETTVFFCLFLLFSTLSNGQQTSIDTVLTIPELTIKSSRLQYLGKGTSYDDFDSKTLQTYQTASVSDLLQSETNVFIKTYGQGSLATPSVRGTGANHTAILWNGINLQSTMNGIADLALLPTFFNDEVLLSYGGSGALFGTGAVGGALHLNTALFENEGLNATVTTSFGSFALKNFQGKVKFSDNKFGTATRLFYRSATNNFPFENIAEAGTPTMLQSNAGLNQFGFLHENAIKINKNQRFDFKVWYQNTYRQIAPTMTQDTSAAFQKDLTTRLLAGWEQKGAIASWKIKVAYLDEQIYFTDSLINLFAENYGSSLVSTTENQTQLSDNQTISFGVNYTLQSATTDNYTGRPLQHRLAGFAAYSYTSRNKRSSFNFTLRQERIDSLFAPIVPSFGGKIDLSPTLSLQGFVSRNYRVPTFNDLFWTPGGNPELLPESGWSQEIAFTWVKQLKSNYIKFNLQAFNHQINNWIQWLPQNTGIWQPINIKSVRSSGGSLNAFYQRAIQQGQWSIQVRYTYTNSVNKEIYSGNQSSLDKQLIYTPKHSGHLNFNLSYKDFEFRYIHQFTGKRYTTSNNNEASALPYFQVGNLNLSKRILINEEYIDLQLSIRNLWGANYQVIAWQPMPQQNWEIGITWNFSNKTNTTNEH